MIDHKIKARETVYTGRAFKIEKIDVELPNGRKARYDLVRHMGAVTILPVDEEGKIYFVRQYRLGAESALLELPAGTLDKNEDPLDCAKREIREEVGMRAEKWTKLGDFFLAPGYSSEHMTVYLAQDLHPDPKKGDEDEFLQVEKIAVNSVLEMKRTNLIHDGKTLAALALGLPVLGVKES